MPRASDALGVLGAHLGLHEQPDGSNYAPPITEWYYRWRAAWCAMTVSFAWAHGGFSDDGGDTLNLGRFGLAQTTAKGWAFVPYMASAFRAAGRWVHQPIAGSAFVTPDEGHTGLVLHDNGDGTYRTREGNFANSLTEVTRRVSSTKGFCLPPFDDVGAPGPSTNPNAWPGRVLRVGVKGRGGDVEHWQRHARYIWGYVGTERGEFTVDGDFGPISELGAADIQRRCGLAIDGEVGPNTWGCTFGAVPA